MSSTSHSEYRGAFVAVLAVIALVGPLASVAHAHPEEGMVASNYRAEITAVAPDPGVLDLRIGGGDSWIEMTVEPGHEVLVLGYEQRLDGGEPYIRVDADGSVHVNGNSPASWMNEERYGDVDIPEWVDPAAPPRWQIVATAGAHYAEWHDHRTHWMSPQLPPAVRDDPGSRHTVLDWEVPLVVDGQDIVIRGTLHYLPNHSPLWPLLVGVLAAAGAFLAGRDGRERLAATAALVAGLSVTAVVVGAATHPDSATGPGALVLPLLAVVAAGVGLAPRSRFTGGGVLVASIAVAAAALPQVTTTIRPLVFSTLPRPAIVVLVPLALGLAIGAVAAMFTGIPEAEPPPRPEAEAAR